jgi:pilus assembly protein CpaE
MKAEPADTQGAHRRLGPKLPTAPTASRSSIHLFCEGDKAAELAAAALSDQRLRHVKAGSHRGGLETACGAYVETATPDLIVVESSLDAGGIIADLERLAEVCDAGTKVIVIGHLNDVVLYRELLRRDISDYLVAPFDPRQLADSIVAALTGGAAPSAGRLVAFFGAKGGCGSSTICHNTAWVLAELMQADTVIADFDLAFGTLGLNFNQDGARGLSEALGAGERLDAGMIAKLVSKCSDRLGLLTASCALDQESRVAPQTASHLIAQFRQSASFTLLDLPREWSGWPRDALTQADHVIITAEPDLANLRNAKNLIETLKASEKSPLLVLNKTGMPRRPEIAVRDFANAVDLEPAATFAFDAQLFGAAANNGLMIGEVSANARQLDLFRRLAELIGAPPEPERQRGLIRPLLMRLGRKLAM